MHYIVFNFSEKKKKIRDVRGSLLSGRMLFWMKFVPLRRWMGLAVKIKFYNLDCKNAVNGA